METTTHPVEAKNLSRQAPRSPREKLGGYVLMARMIDKGRATIAGMNGEYHFDCPVDNLLFSFKGVTGVAVRQTLSSTSTDQEVLDWFNTHGTPRTPEEIRVWSEEVEKTLPFDNPDKREWFSGECERLGLNPPRTTLFDYLEADDIQTFE